MSSVVDVKKKKGERFDALLRRFNRRILESGKVFEARKGRHNERPENKRRLKERALRKLEIGEKREWLRKTGQLPEEFKRDRRR